MAKGYNLTVQLNLQGPKNVGQVVSGINKKLSNINANVNVKLPPGVAQQLSSLQNNFKGIKNQANISASAVEDFGKSAGLAIKRFGAFTAATAGFYAITRATTQSLQQFIEYDRQLVRIAQVTGTTKSSLASLSSEITNLSTSLGASSGELARTAVTLSQAGLSARETESALKALAMTTLAPTFNDMNQTVEGSIALMKQFSISTGELEGALGSINAVAGQFAVEAGDIITAIQRTGGVFAAASNGVSQGTDALNEFIAVFTSVRATSRESAETIATGLRTIFTRIQREDTIDALKAFGVTLTDLEGKFVGPFQAIEKLSEGLKSLDPRDVKFSNIIEELGGFRQVGKVIPLIQQFATAQQALNVAQQGSGSLAIDAATGQQALGVQIAKVGEEFNSLIRSIGQTEEFQNFIRMSLDLASALITVGDSVKSLLPALAALGAVSIGRNITKFSKGFKGGLGLNQGGLVPGSGNTDTVKANLTPGEFVLRKKAVQNIGLENLHKMNRYASGGTVSASSLPSSKIRKKLTRTGSQKQYSSGDKINSGDTIKLDIQSLPVDAGPKIGNTAFEKKVAAQYRGKWIGGNAPVDVVAPGYGPIEVRNRNKFTPDNILADKLARYNIGKGKVLSNKMQLDTINLGRMYVAYNTGKLSAQDKEQIQSKKKQKTTSKKAKQTKKPIAGLFRKKKASGGAISGEDTVPALLTPGEFVLNRKAASRIGASNLNKLNKADKVQGFNGGGFVGGRARFNKGGEATGLGTLGLVFAIQGAASAFASSVEDSGSSFANQVAGTVQGGVGGVTTGLITNQALSGIKSLSGLAGPVGIAVGAITGLTGAIGGFINAGRKFENQLSSERIGTAVTGIENAFSRLEKNVNSLGALRDVAGYIREINQENTNSRTRSRQSPEVSFVNFFDSGLALLSGATEKLQAAAERSTILSRRGVFGESGYLAASSSDSERERIMKELNPSLARDNAADPQVAAAADNAVKFIEQRIAQGVSFEDIVDTSAFSEFTKAVSMADVAIQTQIRNIQSSTALTQQQKDAQIKNILATQGETLVRNKVAGAIAKQASDTSARIGQTISRSLTRIFSTMESIIKGVGASASVSFDKISSRVGSASGRASSNIDTNKLMNVLKNPQAFGQSELNRTVDRITPLLGEQGNIIGSLAKASNQIEGRILSSINRAFKDNPDSTDGKIASIVERDIRALVGELNLPSDVASNLSSMIRDGLEGLRTSGDDKVGLQDIRDKISGFSQTIEGLKGAQDIVIAATQEYGRLLSGFNSITNQRISAQQRSNQLLANSFDIVRNGALSLSKALSDGVSLESVSRNEQASIAQTTGGPTSVQDILDNVTRLQQRSEGLTSLRDTYSSPTEFNQFDQLNTQVINTSVALNENVSALQRMAQNTQLASAALSEIQSVRQTRESQATFLEGYVSSGPDQLDALNGAFAGLERAVNGQATTIYDSIEAQKAFQDALQNGESMYGAQRAAQGVLAEERGNVLSLVKEIAPFMSPEESRGMRGDVLEQYLKDLGQLTPRFMDVINSIRNPAEDPAAQEAISYYRSSIEKQSNASIALAAMQDTLNRQLQENSAQAMRNALNGMTVVIDANSANAIARAIQPPPPPTIIVQGGGQATTKADGGMIYASDGGHMFKKKGTDTVPAMLTPGEFVVNKEATNNNMGMLKDINSGKVQYKAGGGVVGPYSSPAFKKDVAKIQSSDSFYPISSWQGIRQASDKPSTYYTATNRFFPFQQTDQTASSFPDPAHFSKRIAQLYSQVENYAMPGYSSPLTMNKLQPTDEIQKKLEENITNRSETLNTVRSYTPANAGASTMGAPPPQAVFDESRLRELAQQNNATPAQVKQYLLTGKVTSSNLDTISIPMHGSSDAPNAITGGMPFNRLNLYGHDQDLNQISLGQVRPIPSEEYAKYREKFGQSSRSLSRLGDPRRSPLSSIKGPLNSDGTMKGALNTNLQEGGQYGLFTSNSSSDISRSYKVSRNGNKIDVSQSGSGNISVDKGKQYNVTDLLEKKEIPDLLNHSVSVYDAFQKTKAMLQRGQKGKLDAESQAFVKNLDSLYNNNSMYKKLNSNFFDGISNPIGLSPVAKSLYDNPELRRKSLGWPLSRSGRTKLLGLTDKVPDGAIGEILQSKQSEKKKDIANRMMRMGSVEAMQIPLDIPMPLQARRLDPSIPRSVKLSLIGGMDSYQGVFYDESKKRFKAKSIDTAQDYITGLTRSTLIPRKSENSIFADYEGFLSGSVQTDAFTRDPREITSGVKTAIRNNLPRVQKSLLSNDQTFLPENMPFNLGRGMLVGSSNSEFGKVYQGLNRGSRTINISKAMQAAVMGAKTGLGLDDTQSRGLTGNKEGKNLAAKYNDMVRDASAFWGNRFGGSFPMSVRSDEEALSAAKQVASGFNNSPEGSNNETFRTWLAGWGQAFSNVDSKLIDSYSSATPGGSINVNTVRLARDLASAKYLQGKNITKAKLNEIDNANLAGADPTTGKVGTYSGYFDSVMDPYKSFTAGSRPPLIDNLFKKLVDLSVFPTESFGGIPSSQQALGNSNVLESWYGRIQDLYISQLKKFSGDNNTGLKAAFFRKSIAPRFPRNMSTAQKAHAVLGGSKFGRLPGLIDIGRMGGLSNPAAALVAPKIQPRPPVGSQETQTKPPAEQETPPTQNFATGGPVYAQAGMKVPSSMKKGTDTVPAMLTPGEFVINKKATQKHRGLLESINGGGSPQMSQGVTYAQYGGQIQWTTAMQEQYDKLAEMLTAQAKFRYGMGAQKVISLAVRGQAKQMAYNMVMGKARQDAFNKQMLAKRQRYAKMNMGDSSFKKVKKDDQQDFGNEQLNTAALKGAEEYFNALSPRGKYQWSKDNPYIARQLQQRRIAQQRVEQQQGQRKTGRIEGKRSFVPERSEQELLADKEFNQERFNPNTNNQRAIAHQERMAKQGMMPDPQNNKFVKTDSPEGRNIRIQRQLAIKKQEEQRRNEQIAAKKETDRSKQTVQPAMIRTEKPVKEESTIAKYNREREARRKEKRAAEDKARAEREQEIQDIQTNIDSGNSRKKISGMYTKEGHNKEIRRRKELGYDPGLSLEDVRREDILRENLTKQKELKAKERQATIKMNRKQNKKGLAKQKEGTTGITDALLVAGDIFDIGAQYIEGTIRTGVGVGMSAFENPLRHATGDDDRLTKSRSQLEIEQGGALSLAATERLFSLGEGGVDPRKRPRQQNLDKIKDEKRHTAEELGVGTPVAIAESTTTTASQFLAPGMPVVKVGGAVKKGGKQVLDALSEVVPPRIRKIPEVQLPGTTRVDVVPPRGGSVIEAAPPVGGPGSSISSTFQSRYVRGANPTPTVKPGAKANLVQDQYNALRASQSAPEASQWMKSSGNVDIDNKALRLLEQRYQTSKLNSAIAEGLAETTPFVDSVPAIPAIPSRASLLSKPKPKITAVKQPETVPNLNRSLTDKIDKRRPTGKVRKQLLQERDEALKLEKHRQLYRSRDLQKPNKIPAREKAINDGKKLLQREEVPQPAKSTTEEIVKPKVSTTQNTSTLSNGTAEVVKFKQMGKELEYSYPKPVKQSPAISETPKKNIQQQTTPKPQVKPEKLTTEQQIKKLQSEERKPIFGFFGIDNSKKIATLRQAQRQAKNKLTAAKQLPDLEKKAAGKRFSGDSEYLKEWNALMDAGVPNKYRTYGTLSEAVNPADKKLSNQLGDLANTYSTTIDGKKLQPGAGQNYMGDASGLGGKTDIGFDPTNTPQGGGYRVDNKGNLRIFNRGDGNAKSPNRRQQLYNIPESEITQEILDNLKKLGYYQNFSLGGQVKPSYFSRGGRTSFPGSEAFGYRRFGGRQEAFGRRKFAGERAFGRRMSAADRAFGYRARYMRSGGIAVGDPDPYRRLGHPGERLQAMKKSAEYDPRYPTPYVSPAFSFLNQGGVVSPNYFAAGGYLKDKNLRTNAYASMVNKTLGISSLKLADGVNRNKQGYWDSNINVYDPDELAIAKKSPQMVNYMIGKNNPFRSNRYNAGRVADNQAFEAQQSRKVDYNTQSIAEKDRFRQKRGGRLNRREALWQMGVMPTRGQRYGYSRGYRIVHGYDRSLPTQYASEGSLIDFQPKGTDTVPAMLTPGEFVVNRESTKNNLGLLKQINNNKTTSPTQYASTGGIVYAADGGSVDNIKVNSKIDGTSGAITVAGSVKLESDAIQFQMNNSEALSFGGLGANRVETHTANTADQTMSAAPPGYQGMGMGFPVQGMGPQMIMGSGPSLAAGGGMGLSPVQAPDMSTSIQPQQNHQYDGMLRGGSVSAPIQPPIQPPMQPQLQQPQPQVTSPGFTSGQAAGGVDTNALSILSSALTTFPQNVTPLIGALESFSSGQIGSSDIGGASEAIGQPIPQIPPPTAQQDSKPGTTQETPQMDFSAFSNGVEKFVENTSSLQTTFNGFKETVTSLSSINFGVIQNGADTFSASIAALSGPVNSFSAGVDQFANKTATLIDAIADMGEIRGEVTVGGHISVDDMTINVAGLQAIDRKIEGLKAEITNSVALLLSRANPGFNVSDLRSSSQLRGGGK